MGSLALWFLIGFGHKKAEQERREREEGEVGIFTFLASSLHDFLKLVSSSTNGH